MESNWRWNVIRQGWDSWAGTGILPYYPRVDKLAFLVTPVVIFGVTYTGLMNIVFPGYNRRYYCKTGLSPMADPFMSFPAPVNSNPWPDGIAISPDH